MHNCLALDVNLNSSRANIIANDCSEQTEKYQRQIKHKKPHFGTLKSVKERKYFYFILNIKLILS